MDLITLKEYAEMHNKDLRSLRKKAADGGFKTATKLGRQWVIDKNEEFVDNRVITGKYKNFITVKEEVGITVTGEFIGIFNEYLEIKNNIEYESVPNKYIVFKENLDIAKENIKEFRNICSLF